MGARYLQLTLLLVIVAGASLLLGQGSLRGDTPHTLMLLELRGTRLLAAGLVGAALAVAGTLVQGLFRNPLADPSILGTTAGANLGGKIAMLAFQGVAGGAAAPLGISPELMLPIGCVGGALGALVVMLAIERATRDLVVMLLAGFLLSSLLVSIGGFVTSLAMDRFELARAMLEFTLGDVATVGMRRVWLGMPLLVFGSIAAWLWARPLDLLLSGEDEARSLGLDVDEVRRACVLWVALLTAAAVAVGGSVSFVGLVVPQVLRPIVGAAHRRLVPSAALLGAAFVIACDGLTRVAPTHSPLPLGVVTGLIGAPLFLGLLLRSQRGGVRGG